MNGRGSGRPFAPGRSGNPGGRPKREGLIRELAQAATKTVFLRLLEIATKGEDERSVVLACNAILDRGWGKPAQTVELDARHEWGGEEIVTITSANPILPARVVDPSPPPQQLGGRLDQVG